MSTDRRWGAGRPRSLCRQGGRRDWGDRGFCLVVGIPPDTSVTGKDSSATQSLWSLVSPRMKSGEDLRPPRPSTSQGASPPAPPGTPKGLCQTPPLSTQFSRPLRTPPHRLRVVSGKQDLLWPTSEPRLRVRRAEGQVSWTGVQSRPPTGPLFRLFPVDWGPTFRILESLRLMWDVPVSTRRCWGVRGSGVVRRRSPVCEDRASGATSRILAP